MGIAGLLPFLRPITRPIHVSALEGQSVGVDGYVWLHRGVFTCALDLFEGNIKPSLVDYCMERVRLLQRLGVRPYIVFDGCRLPLKSETEESRESLREENATKARAALQFGRTKEAHDYASKAVRVTPCLAYEFILSLKKAGVDYVVAPYEADAQLAYMCRKGMIAAAISDDSDLLVFGCPRVIFKLDKFGDGQQILLEDITKIKEFRFMGFTQEYFRQCCILGGCDYLKSLPGVGLKTGVKLLRRYRKIEAVVRFLRMSGKSVPRTYVDDFRKAEMCFQHQRVFDPGTKSLTTLIPVGDEEETAFDRELGPLLDGDKARSICSGERDPETLEIFPHNSSYQRRANVPRNQPISGAGSTKSGKSCKELTLDQFWGLASLPTPKPGARAVVQRSHSARTQPKRQSVESSGRQGRAKSDDRWEKTTESRGDSVPALIPDTSDILQSSRSKQQVPELSSGTGSTIGDADSGVCCSSRGGRSSFTSIPHASSSASHPGSSVISSEGGSVQRNSKRHDGTGSASTEGSVSVLGENNRAEVQKSRHDTDPAGRCVDSSSAADTRGTTEHADASELALLSSPSPKLMKEAGTSTEGSMAAADGQTLIWNRPSSHGVQAPCTSDVDSPESEADGVEQDVTGRPILHVASRQISGVGERDGPSEVPTSAQSTPSSISRELEVGEDSFALPLTAEVDVEVISVCSSDDSMFLPGKSNQENVDCSTRTWQETGRLSTSSFDRKPYRSREVALHPRKKPRLLASVAEGVSARKDALQMTIDELLRRR